MKTITVDWETYQEELKAKYHRGVEMGLWYASRYLTNPEANPISDEYEFERGQLHVAMQDLLNK